MSILGYEKFTVFKRLGLGYLVILLIVITLGVYSTLTLSQLNQITRSISFIDSETIRTASRLRDAILSQRGFDKKYIISEDKDFHRQFLTLLIYQVFVKRNIHHRLTLF